MPQDVRTFVEGLELQDPNASYFKVRPTRGPALTPEEIKIKEQTEQAFFNDKSLVSFVSEVSGQNRKDVLNSTLLAQLAANKEVPDPDKILDWYQKFVDVLS